MAAPPVVALEIGTSKTMALVGELREDNYIMITGSGETVSKGVRKGDVIDVDGAAESVKAALEMAEEIGKVTIRQVYLSFAGGHIQSLTNRGTVPIVSRDRVISDEDVAQVCQVARAVSLSQEREIFHSLSQQFEIDDHERVMRPEGMAGARLSHDMLILHCLRNRLETTVRMVRSIPIHVEDVVFSGLCSALAVLTPEQKKSGVVAVDLGAGKTDYVVYAGNVAVSAGVVAVGGDHVTNDIALAFNISTSQAERLKCSSGSAQAAPAQRLQRASLPPEVGFPGRSVSLSALQTVVEARVAETLGIVRGRLEKDGVFSHLGAGVVLTGGGVHLKNVVDLAEKVFGLPCATGCPRGVTGMATVSDGPEYATCAGLVQHGFKAQEETRRTPTLKRWLKGVLGR